MTYYFVWVPVCLYLAGWLLAFVRFWRSGFEMTQWGGGIIAIGWGAHTVFLISRLTEQSATTDLLLGVAAWGSMIVYYFVQRRFHDVSFSFVIPPFAVALMLVATLNSAGSILLPEPLTSPVLTRNLLIVHIVTVLAGLALFALACLFSITYLYQERLIKAKQFGLKESRLPSLGALEHLNHKAITLGFFFLSVGIMLGMLVAAIHHLPVRLFSWRQIIPVLTWLVYAVFLIEHSLQGRRGRFAAIWSITGFFVVTGALIVELALVVGE